GRDTELTIRLVPQELTATQAAEVTRLHESMRHGEEIEQGPYVEQGDLHATAAMAVIPDEVRVENLEGFTGMMNLDEFIGGVVTREMNDGFPREALRAQAIASRSYALHRLRTRGMANGGQAYNSTSGSLSRAAALQTTKQVLLYNGAIAQAFFSARCNGDFTLDSEDGPTLANCFPGGLTTAVVPYCRSRPCSGHINCSETSEQCCELTVNGKVNYIYGHGVGMCQRGAQGFANRGVTYSTMLTNYYTGVVIYNGALPNSLSVRMIPATGGTTNNLVLEIRSTRPHTLFDIQSTSVLSGGGWTSFLNERALTTGASSVVQIQPQATLAAVKYYRALLR
ncbi:MAG: SpoIID/LytB domain-containing protein, partial [Limisphaerales bacterium]